MAVEGSSLPVFLPAADCTLGVVGGGQLGRMFAQAAQRLGFGVAVLDPDTQCPAARVVEHHVQGAYDDAAAAQALARRAVAFTTEFENVPAGTMRQLASQGPVSPDAEALAICQHRAREKAHFVQAGVPCAAYALVEDESTLAAAQARPLFPGILKTATLGYDGKGQAPVESPEALRAAWESLHRQPCVLEERVDLVLELSVIVARGRDGRVVHLPVQQNLHRDGILAVTQVPAPEVPGPVADRAVEQAQQIAASMDYVGVLCVEFFVVRDGRLLANEMAPRPHNSGHYSIDACDLSQFELQVRTLAGLPLVAPRLQAAAVMLNLLGDLWLPPGVSAPQEPAWDAVLALPGVHLHLYGKQQARRGRKMGHLTVTAADARTAREVALEAARRLGLPAF